MPAFAVVIVVWIATVTWATAPAAAQTTIVTADVAVVRSAPGDTTPALLTVPRQTAIELRAGVPKGGEEWLKIRATTAEPAAAVTGWIRTRDVRMSDGLTALWLRRFPEAATRLAVEILQEQDLATSTWLSFQLGYAYQSMNRLDQAARLFEQLAGRRPAGARTPFAHLAAARVHLERHDVAAMLRTYEALLALAPDYIVTEHASAANGVNFRGYFRWGEPRIAARVTALRALAARQAATDRVLATPSATTEQKAQAWFELGEEWERKNAIDPGFQETRVPSDDPEHCYKMAVALAPGTAVGGDARWRLIALSEPYEWEGDVEERAAWTVREFSAFLRDYPEHRHAGEALFKMATAVWARGGYPEAFGIVFDPGGWPDFGPRYQELEQWFVTPAFGGFLGLVAVPNRDEAARALAMFKEVVVKYPTSVAAPKAQYDAAVILDYCLKDTARAIAEFENFLTMAPQLEPFATKARARLAVLRRP